MKPLVLIGTRPEALKMAPVILELQKLLGRAAHVVISGQQSGMVEQALDIFDIRPTFTFLAPADRSATTNTIASILLQLQKLHIDMQYDCIFVHGDTATTLAGAIFGYYTGIKIYHVEAGLRTGNLFQPWPEEGNRRLVGILATKHFAPTQAAKSNLLAEGIPESNIHVTGNTIVDALEYVKNNHLSALLLHSDIVKYINEVCEKYKVILVTAHRRENFGQGIENICEAVIELSHDRNLKFIIPVHPNPNVQNTIRKLLRNVENVKLVEPLDYKDLLYVLNHCFCVLTDSGGIQEEAPSFRKPVFILRETTERPEILHAGIGKLVGTNTAMIVTEVQKILSDSKALKKMSSAENPFGTGRAAKIIVESIQDE